MVKALALPSFRATPPQMRELTWMGHKPTLKIYSKQARLNDSVLINSGGTLEQSIFLQNMKTNKNCKNKPQCFNNLYFDFSHKMKTQISERFSKFSTTYFSKSNSEISNQEWSSIMFKQLNLSANGSLLTCMAKCFFAKNQSCKVLVYQFPFCYFGDPTFRGTLNVPNGNQPVFGNYGKFFQDFIRKFLLLWS